MKLLDALDDKTRSDLIKVTLVMILALWTLLSFVPWINLAYGDTALWISALFALSGAPAIAGIYLCSLALAKSGMRASIQHWWRKNSLFVGAYSVIWIMAFSFLG